jgi:hypothetical protein
MCLDYSDLSPSVCLSEGDAVLAIQARERRRIILGNDPLLQGHVGFHLTDEGHRRFFPT